MILADPHIHLYARTTDNYERMYGDGLRVVLEPSLHMARNGFTESQISELLFDNPLAFYRQSGRLEPRLDLPFVHPSMYQR